ncbi:MAG: methionyl-tRNA formyltransferase [bacterium]|nr:methionyl-tRNA formyltransferase [bacterium]
MSEKPRETKNVKIAFAGSGPFAEPIFKALVENFDNLNLVTKKDKPRGRGGASLEPALKKLAKSKDIPIFEAENKLEFEKVTEQINPDLVIVSSLGIIITPKTLDMPKYGFLNVHYSLLPLHRGSSPVQSTILSGDKKAGFVIQKVAEEVDAGDIIYKDELDLNGRETTETLGETLLNMAAAKLPDIIMDYIDGKITPKTQDHSKATFSKIIQKSDGKIDWNEPAETIERKVRAYAPWPSAYTFWDGKMLKIIEATASDINSGQKPGTFIKLDSGSGSEMTGLYGVQTIKGTLLVNKVQLEGKKPLKTSDFLLGNSKIIGEILS